MINLGQPDQRAGLCRRVIAGARFIERLIEIVSGEVVQIQIGVCARGRRDRALRSVPGEAREPPADLQSPAG